MCQDTGSLPVKKSNYHTQVKYDLQNNLCAAVCSSVVIQYGWEKHFHGARYCDTKLGLRPTTHWTHDDTYRPDAQNLKLSNSIIDLHAIIVYTRNDPYQSI